MALLTVAAMIATSFGKNELAAFLNAPGTADSLVLIVGTAGTLVAGALAGVQAPAKPAA